MSVYSFAGKYKKYSDLSIDLARSQRPRLERFFHDDAAAMMAMMIMAAITVMATMIVSRSDVIGSTSA